MNFYDHVKKHEEYLRQICIAGLYPSDYRDLKIYEDFSRLSRDGLKVQYCVDYCASKYEVSEASVWRIIRRFREQI